MTATHTKQGRGLNPAAKFQVVGNGRLSSIADRLIGLCGHRFFPTLSLLGFPSHSSHLLQASLPSPTTLRFAPCVASSSTASYLHSMEVPQQLVEAWGTWDKAVSQATFSILKVGDATNASANYSLTLATFFFSF